MKALLFIIPLLLVAGCTNYGDTKQEGPLYNPRGEVVSIEIVSPQDGAVLENTSAIGVTVRVSGINLIDVPTDRQNRDGYGHVSYFLDGAREHKSPFISHSFTNVAKGVHTVRAELRNNDDTPLTIPIYDEATVTMK